MSAVLLDGKLIASRIRQEVATDIIDLEYSPGLGVILVGEDSASRLYVSLKEKACASVGIRMEIARFPVNATQQEILATVGAFNVRTDIDAVLVQLPLPSSLDTGRIIAAIDPSKDVDGFHPANIASLRAGAPLIVPGLSASIVELIRAADEPLNGKRTLVIGNSETFYSPLETVLEGMGLVPSFRRADAVDVSQMSRIADVLIVAVGRSRFVTGDMIKPGAIIIDIGTNKADDTTVGDVDAAAAAQVAGYMTPVPGGVGPVTVAMLLKNTVALARRRSHHG